MDRLANRDRKGEGGTQPDAFGDCGARKVGFRRDIANPYGLTRRQDAPNQTIPIGKHHGTRHVDKCGEVSGVVMPEVEIAHEVRLDVQFPQGSQVPSQEVAHRVEYCRRDVTERCASRQDVCHLMFHGETLFRLLTLGDVTENSRKDPLTVHLHLGNGGFGGKDLAVFSLSMDFPALVHLARLVCSAAKGRNLLGMGRPCCFRKQHGEGVPEHFLGRIPKDATSALIEIDNLLGVVHRDNGVVRGVQYALKQGGVQDHLMCLAFTGC